VSACGEGRVSAGSSVGCEGTGAVCCIFGADAGTNPADAGADAAALIAADAVADAVSV
jgi:hypothetical protein